MAIHPGKPFHHHHQLHPQAKLPASSAGSNPIRPRMKLRNGGHGRDALAAQLRHLLASPRVHVDEAVHVADAEALDAVRGLQLPLGA